MTYQSLSASQEYQDALSALESLEAPAVGFQKPSDLSTQAKELATAQIKQNNTIIALLIQANTTLDQCKVALATIQSTLQATPSVDPTERALAGISAQLANLKLGPSTGTQKPVHKPTGPLYVHRKPADLIRKAKEKETQQ